MTPAQHATRIYQAHDWPDKGIAPLGLAIPMLRLSTAAASHINPPKTRSANTQQLLTALTLVSVEAGMPINAVETPLSTPRKSKPPKWDYGLLMRRVSLITSRFEHTISLDDPGHDNILQLRIDHTLALIRVCLPPRATITNILDHIIQNQETQS